MDIIPYNRRLQELQHTLTNSLISLGATELANEIHHIVGTMLFLNSEVYRLVNGDISNAAHSNYITNPICQLNEKLRALINYVSNIDKMVLMPLIEVQHIFDLIQHIVEFPQSNISNSATSTMQPPPPLHRHPLSNSQSKLPPSGLPKPHSSVSASSPQNQMVQEPLKGVRIDSKTSLNPLKRSFNQIRADTSHAYASLKAKDSFDRFRGTQAIQSQAMSTLYSNSIPTNTQYSAPIPQTNYPGNFPTQNDSESQHMTFDYHLLNASQNHQRPHSLTPYISNSYQRGATSQSRFDQGNPLSKLPGEFGISPTKLTGNHTSAQLPGPNARNGDQLSVYSQLTSSARAQEIELNGSSPLLRETNSISSSQTPTDRAQTAQPSIQPYSSTSSTPTFNQVIESTQVSSESTSFPDFSQSSSPKLVSTDSLLQQSVIQPVVDITQPHKNAHEVDEGLTNPIRMQAPPMPPRKLIPSNAFSEAFRVNSSIRQPSGIAHQEQIQRPVNEGRFSSYKYTKSESISAGSQFNGGSLLSHANNPSGMASIASTSLNPSVSSNSLSLSETIPSPPPEMDATDEEIWKGLIGRTSTRVARGKLLRPESNNLSKEHQDLSDLLSLISK